MYKRLLSGLRRDNHKLMAQMFRYGLVSLVALLFDFGTLVLLTEVFKIHYLISASVGFSIGIVVNYICTRLWVFDKSKLSRQSVEFGAFFMVGISGLLLNNLIMWVFTSGLGLLYIFSKIISTAVVFFWNFFLRKYFIYS